MALKEEYGLDITLNGKTYCLDNVENYPDGKTNENVIRKRWRAADGSVHYTEKRTPLPPPKKPAVANKPTPTAPPSAHSAPDSNKKDGLLRRAAKSLRHIGSAD